LIKDIDVEKDDVEHDNSYFIGTLEDGQKMATEWTPEARLVNSEIPSGRRAVFPLGGFFLQ